MEWRVKAFIKQCIFHLRPQKYNFWGKTFHSILGWVVPYLYLVFNVCCMWVLRIQWSYFLLKSCQDFPSGTVVKNLPANAGDTGSSPGPGRSHMPQSNEARAPQLLSLRSRACEPQLLSPHATTTEALAPRARAPQQKKPPQWEAHALQRRVPLAHRY